MEYYEVLAHSLWLGICLYMPGADVVDDIEVFVGWWVGGDGGRFI